jgi:hypothetical protein
MFTWDSIEWIHQVGKNWSLSNIESRPMYELQIHLSLLRSLVLSCMVFSFLIDILHILLELHITTFRANISTIVC